MSELLPNMEELLKRAEEKGRREAIKEYMMRDCESCRAKVIEELKAKVQNEKSKSYQFNNMDYASGFLSALLFIDETLEQIKRIEE